MVVQMLSSLRRQLLVRATLQAALPCLVAPHFPAATRETAPWGPRALSTQGSGGQEAQLASSQDKGKKTSQGGGTEKCAALPPRPEEPGPEDCCQSGCEFCVWTTYLEELKEWEEKKERLERK